MLEFSKDKKLLHRSEFTATMDRGVKIVMPHVVLLGRCNETSTSRVGFIVSKKIGGAVVRNLVKRRLRELFRTFDARPEGLDIVVISRVSGRSCGFDDLGQSLRGGLRLLEQRIVASEKNRDLRLSGAKSSRENPN